MTISSEPFPTDTDGLSPACPPETVELADGEEITLRIAPVAKSLGEDVVRMLAYNGSVPGPTLRVQQGSELVVHVVNDGDLETTVHWHGLRLANEYDGTTETQAPIEIGCSFTYRLSFPDPGIYWYHPHIREDIGQELGLAGTIVVEPTAPGYWPSADREVVLVLDDVLVEDGRIAPFSRSEATFVAMGRFGNVILANGDPQLALTGQEGEIVRLYLVNTANTRVFNVGMPGARLKRVGGDSGRYEREELVEGVILAPSERAVVDVLLDEAGELVLEHRTPDRTYPLATIAVAALPQAPGDRFDDLRVNAEMVAERERITPYLDAEPDKTIAFVGEMDMGEPELAPGTTLTFTCPMHPEVMDAQPGRCPRCGMKLLATASAFAIDRHAGAHDHTGGHDDAAAHSHDGDGIEWEDDMLEVNRLTTPENMRWKLVDRDTGAEGHDIDWRFRVGDQVKIRLVNEMDSDHPMHHPFHVHGAGRFLILARDGIVEPNLAWKDTVLVPTGQVVDILLDVTHPGRWMAHCHIAEHHESGMMLGFTVDP